jgi:hypothetical protein
MKSCGLRAAVAIMTATLIGASGLKAEIASAKLVVLPNPKGPSPAAHYFVDNQQALVDTVSKWLAEQRL